MRKLSPTDHRNLPPALAFLLLFCAFAFGKSAEAQDLTYRSTVAEVRLTFFVTDEHNQTIRTLQPGDFAVVDDGLVIREFSSFVRSDVTSLDVVVLVDSSESVVSRFRYEIADVLQLISQSRWIADDNISVLSFDGPNPKIICAGNCRSAPAVDRLLAAPARGSTPLFDAVVFAARLLSQRRDPRARPVLILFSDGQDTISRDSFSEAVEAALGSDTQIYAVDVNDPERLSEGARTLQQLADATGGRYFPGREGSVKVLEAVFEDLHAIYVATYKPPKHGEGFHSVRILPTHNLNLQFHCRRSYRDQGSVR